MIPALEQLDALMAAKESEHLEFKEAKASFEFEDQAKYCCALANERGGTIILGITDRQPRKVVGSQAFADLERTKQGLTDRLRLRIEADALAHPSDRVVVFSVPSRPLGMPIQYKGAYWMRAGDALVPMTQDVLKRIFDETTPDYSAEVCPAASVADLDAAAIEQLRARWCRKTSNDALLHVPAEQLLADAELVADGKVTYAALVLLGTPKSLARRLAAAEVIFEYRSSEGAIEFHQRKEYRQGFFAFGDDLWNVINLRNDVQHFQDGLFMWDIPTFSETVVREAILNAVSHRDYRLAGSVFIRQFPRKLEIVSPGGFPPGVTADNVLWTQSPRNRRIAEVLAKCGLVERSGQGMNRMFEGCIRQGKRRPDFTGTDDFQVWITLHGEVQDPAFLRFLEQISKERLAAFRTEDLLILDLLHRDQAVPQRFRDRLPWLVEQGAVETMERGRGTRYILSGRFYSFLGKRGVYTRKRGLNRETNKMLLLKHIADNRAEGSPLQELIQVLPALSRRQLQKLLTALRDEGQIHLVGQTKAGRWFPDPEPDRGRLGRGKNTC